MDTEAINHDPAITFFQTGSQIAGRPSLGAWVHYGLGSETDGPAGVRRADHAGQSGPAALLAASGAAGSFPPGTRACSSAAAAIRCSTSRTPTAWPARAGARLLDRLNDLHAHAAARSSDPEIDARIAQYEMAYRMQASVPD